MNFAVIAILIVAALIAGISVNGFIQRREQQAAERRHRVAQHRASVRDGQDMLEIGKTLPLETAVRDVLLQFIELHLQAMHGIDPSAEGLDKQFNWLSEQRQAVAQKTESGGHLTLPSQSEELTALRTQLHRLTEFVARLRQEKRINSGLVLQAFRSLARLRLRCDVEGHIKLGQLAVLNQQSNLAHQYYKYASDRLVQENISDSYVQEQLHMLEGLMAELRGETPLDTSAIEHSTETESSSNSEKDVDPLFAPKKKW